MASCTVRQDKYADSLRIGTTALPKNLNPYSSTASSSTFFVSLFYNTLLGGDAPPADYVPGETYTFLDGSVYTPIDTSVNPLGFTDGLLAYEGALPKKEGSVYGYEYFDPTEEQWKAQCERESIRFGFDENGIAITETEDEFLARALITVPNKNWMRFHFDVIEDYTWSDGTPFTAEDIKFTFDYIIKHAGALGSQAYFLTDYHESNVVDGDFEFILASNNYTSMKSVCNSIVILPKHIWQTVRNPSKEKNLNPVGTGAYYIAEGDYIEDSTITVTLREDYDADLLKDMFAGEPIKNISVILMSNEDVLINAMREGSIDLMMDTVNSSKAYAVSSNADYSDIKISAVNNAFVSTLLFNVGPYRGAMTAGYTLSMSGTLFLIVLASGVVLSIILKLLTKKNLCIFIGVPVSLTAALFASVPLADIFDVAYHAALPVMISVFSGVISYGLLVRNSMIAVTGEDYILTARAKGLPPQVVLYKHTFRNALLPLITNVGMSMAGLMGGSVLMEKIFSWPGMGQLLLDACNNGDYLLSQAILLLFAVITVVCNFITDLVYHKFDPRVKEV